MTPEETVERLQEAELTYREAQREHDGSLASVLRYRLAELELLAARAELSPQAVSIPDAVFAQQREAAAAAHREAHERLERIIKAFGTHLHGNSRRGGDVR